MSLIYVHDPNASEPYLRASFSTRQRLGRLLWKLTWLCLCRPTPVVLHGWRAFILRRFGAKLGKHNLIYPKARIWAPWHLITSDIVTIADDVEIYNPGTVTLGHHAILSQGSFLCSATHDYNDPAFPMTWKKIELGAYAWVCARAVVLPGVKVGEGAVLGAAAVTGKDLAPWSVYAGNPARLVGQRKHPLAAKPASL